MATELDIPYVHGVLSEVLKNRFSQRERRVMKIERDYVQMACPICGDSAHDNHKKRARFFYRDMKLYCYHLGCQGTLTQLATGHGVYMDPEKRMQIAQYASEHARIRQKDEYMDKLIYSLSVDELTKYYEDGPEGGIIGFRPVAKGSKVYKYLVNERMLPEKRVLNEVFEGGVMGHRWIEPVAVFVNMAGNNILGLQTRTARSGSKRFNMHTFSSLYKDVTGTEIDIIEAAHYDKIGSIFNIFNIDLERTVFAFEAYTDSLFFPNSVAGVGTNTDFTPLIDACEDLRFVFDNDKAGFDMAARYVDSHRVFMWKKLFSDLSGRMKDSSLYFRELMKIKDMNKLAQVANTNNPYKALSLDKYFTRDEFDKIWIPKIKKKHQEKSSTSSWDTLKKDIMAWS